MNPKEQLEKLINELEDKALFAKLSEGEQAWLDIYKKKYELILANEQCAKDLEKEEKSREMKQRRGRGKYGEARLAKKVKGAVVGRSKFIKLGSGRVISINCQKPPDVVMEMGGRIFALESKWRKNVPKYLEELMTQAISNCPEGLTPVGVIGDREERQVYYIMMENDWLALSVEKR